MNSIKVAALLAACALVAACTDPPGARAVLEDAGYTDIKITGYEWLSCGRDDTYHTGFTAKSVVSGNRVSGVVCAGLFFKGATIRITGRG